jgi:hypothetical protein
MMKKNIKKLILSFSFFMIALSIFITVIFAWSTTVTVKNGGTLAIGNNTYSVNVNNSGLSVALQINNLVYIDLERETLSTNRTYYTEVNNKTAVRIPFSITLDKSNDIDLRLSVHVGYTNALVMVANKSSNGITTNPNLNPFGTLLNAVDNTATYQGTANIRSRISATNAYFFVSNDFYFQPDTSNNRTHEYELFFWGDYNELTGVKNHSISNVPVGVPKTLYFDFEVSQGRKNSTTMIYFDKQGANSLAGLNYLNVYFPNGLVSYSDIYRPEREGYTFSGYYDTVGTGGTLYYDSHMVRVVTTWTITDPILILYARWV